ncbi:hypothetical protein ZHAS_00005635 [Anopheles sinensis]|uniref:Uncharacterized protein n=1 Tax=Anopheles sinensis TaxID=74873 RepID=A0A084VJZ8_ANOSI|nr:hypothetical protein ZHAS_00005635 [Anopheles sinensis]
MECIVDDSSPFGVHKPQTRASLSFQNLCHRRASLPFQPQFHPWRKVNERRNSMPTLARGRKSR